MAGEGFARQMIDSMKANRAALSRGASKVFGFSGKKSDSEDITSKKKMSPEDFKKFSEQLQQDSKRRRKLQIIVGSCVIIVSSILLFLFLSKIQ